MINREGRKKDGKGYRSAHLGGGEGIGEGHSSRNSNYGCLNDINEALLAISGPVKEEERWGPNRGLLRECSGEGTCASLILGTEGSRDGRERRRASAQGTSRI